MLGKPVATPRDWLISQNKYQDKKTFRKAKTISITSGKGGVGKTSLSLKFAMGLADTGHKVLLIDCDTNLSNTAVKLNLPITNNFYDLISAKKEFHDCLYFEGNFHLLSGCNGSLELFNKILEIDKVIIDILATHEKDYDYIILDCPAGISKETLTLNAYSDFRFVVVTPDKSSVTDSYSLIKILNKEYGISHNHLLLNKISTEIQANRMIKVFGETVEQFLDCRLKILGSINREEVAEDRFDSIFLSKEKNSMHINFMNIVKRFTDEDETEACLQRDSMSAQHQDELSTSY